MLSMSLEPLLSAPWVIQVHAIGAIMAFFLGIVQFIAPKGTFPHKTTGVIWLLIMTAVATTSIVIRPSVLGYDLPITQWFSFIHLFTILTFYGIIGGSLMLLRGGENMKYHYKPFRGIFISGLVIAGGFAFLPGRIMHKVAIGG